MRWNILAFLGILIGFCLIRGGLDSLLEWRAWFLGLSGLGLILLGSLRILLSLRRLRTEKKASASNGIDT